MLRLPLGDGRLVKWRPSGKTPPEHRPGGFRSRIAFAAAHVVADPTRDQGQDPMPPIDWDSTLSYRRYLWHLGFGVAEAMDTAQRGSGIGWEAARELIVRTSDMAADSSGLAVYGAATDQLEPGDQTLGGITDAYSRQVGLIEDRGGMAILMSSRHLATAAAGHDDYLRVYDRVIADASGPVMIHWLGGAFDPALVGYWGSTDIWKAAETVLELVGSNAGKVSGVKLSLLDDELEVDMRRRLPDGVRMYTGDDLNFVDLIQGDDQGYSDALLGVLGPIAPAAVAGFQALDAGDDDSYRRILEPTLPLARHLFSDPTYDYKTGVVFLAYLNGLQPHFHMLCGAESARSLPHLGRLLVLADEAGLLLDPELTEHRMGLVLELGGVT